MSSNNRFFKLLLAINIILLVLSCTFALNLLSKQYHGEYLCPIIIALLVAVNTLFANKTKCKILLKSSLLVTALFGVIEVIYSLTIGGHLHPVIGTLGNPSIFSMSITLYMPALLYFYNDRNKIIRAIILIIYLFTFVAVVMSQSRTGVVCMVVCGIYIIWKTFHFKAKFIYWISIVATIILISSLLFVKSESTLGRRFILERSVEMIQEKPLGWGCKGFLQNYMAFQAEYFRNNNDEDAALLADNMRHPLNEYVYIAINYGLPAVAAIILLTAVLLHYKLKENSNEGYTFILTATLLAIWMFFSYPPVATFYMEHNLYSHAAVYMQ